jgi:hypothetical protein
MPKESARSLSAQLPHSDPEYLNTTHSLHHRTIHCWLSELQPGMDEDKNHFLKTMVC